MKVHLRQTIAANIRTLLSRTKGGAGVGKLVNLGIQNGSATRLLSGEVSIGANLIEQVAKALRVEPWQLCLPNLEQPKALSLTHTALNWPFPNIDIEVIINLSAEESKAIETGLLIALGARGIAPRRSMTE